MSSARSFGNVSIRVDASSEIGLGHLRRCLTLTRQLSLDGFVVRLIGRRCPGALDEKQLGKIPIAWIEDTDEERDAEETLSLVGRSPTGLSWVVVDHYELGERWERIIRDAGHRVLAIDDFRNRRHFADVLVSEINQPFDPALNGCPGKPRWLVGPQFSLVDPEFSFSAEPITNATSTKRILVSYGGSDPTNETAKALAAIRLLRAEKNYGNRTEEFDVVIGQANLNAAELIRLAKEIEGVVVHVAPRSLAPLLRKADLFLTSGGNSMIEALTMQKPCLVTTTADNQALSVSQMLSKGVIISLGSHKMIDSQVMARAVTEAFSKYEAFANEVRTTPVFDLLGASRISKAMQSISKETL